MALIKTLASWGDLIHAPNVQAPQGAVCLTCGRLVDFEGVVEGYPQETTWCKYLVKHHGAEELRTFDMGSNNWDIDDAAQMARRTNWLDPTREGGLGLGQKIENPGDHDEVDE